MTVPDYVTLGIIGAVSVGLLVSMRNANKDTKKLGFDLVLRHGVDDFTIHHQDPDGEWMVLSGGVIFNNTKSGHYVCIEQLTGPRYVGVVSVITGLGGYFGVRIERVE